VTLLVNGLPLVQIELKRSGIEIKEAFNQINTRTILLEQSRSVSIRAIVCDSGSILNIWPTLQSVKQTSFGQMPIIKTRPS
jgi:hypothetical protein